MRGEEGSQTPDKDSSIFRAGDETSTVLCPLDHSDGSVVGVERSEEISSRDLPKEDTSVKGAASYKLAIRRTGDASELCWQDDALKGMVSLPGKDVESCLIVFKLEDETTGSRDGRIW